MERWPKTNTNLHKYSRAMASAARPTIARLNKGLDEAVKFVQVARKFAMGINWLLID